MSTVLEIEKALKQLPREQRWEIVCWLLEDLQEGPIGNGKGNEAESAAESTPVLPDYSARRRRIFGATALPNMVLTARAEER